MPLALDVVGRSDQSPKVCMPVGKQTCDGIHFQEKRSLCLLDGLGNGKQIAGETSIQENQVGVGVDPVLRRSPVLPRSGGQQRRCRLGMAGAIVDDELDADAAPSVELGGKPGAVTLEVTRFGAVVDKRERKNRFHMSLVLREFEPGYIADMLTEIGDKGSAPFLSDVVWISLLQFPELKLGQNRIGHIGD